MITLRSAAGPTLAILWCALASPRAARAQVTPSLDAATSSVSYDDGRGDGLIALSPALELAGSSAVLSLSGTLAARQAGGMASRGAARASIGAPRLGPIRLVGIARSGWDAFDPRGSSGYWRTEARANVGSAARGAWLSLGQGRALDANGWNGVTTAGGGAWTRIGGATLSASLSSARRGGSETQMQIFTHSVPIRDTVPGADTIIGFRSVTDTSWARAIAASTDAEASLRWSHGALALELTGGRRLLAGSELWGGAQAMYWLGPRVALVASGGSLPASIAEGREGSRYLTFGMHWAPRRRDPPREPADPSGGRAPRAPALEVQPASDGTRAIRLRLPEHARTVELMGDFTGWAPVAMRFDDTGAWVATLPVAPGTHRMNLRVDGGAWRVPPGLPPVTDDFNGVAGLLVVR